jgi:hypothetical protein
MVAMYEVSLMPQTWLKGAEGRSRALKRRCGEAERGAAPDQLLRMEWREYLVVRSELRI